MINNLSIKNIKGNNFYFQNVILAEKSRKSMEHDNQVKSQKISCFILIISIRSFGL